MSYLGTGVRPVICGALSNERREEGNVSCKHLSVFLVPLMMSGLIQNAGGCVS